MKTSEVIKKIKKEFINLKYTKIDKESIYGKLYVNFYIKGKDNFDEDENVFLYYFKCGNNISSYF